MRQGKTNRIIGFLFLFLFTITGGSIFAQEDIDVGDTGWASRRPVMAGACATGCPWGEMADFVQEAMEPYGYSVIICRNCNRTYGPRLVSEHDFPPPLDEVNLEDGVNTRINARVDFGVTSSAMLSAAYHNKLAGQGPFRNLRLIAKIEDPFYFLIAFRKALGVTGFEQIKQQKLPVRLLEPDGNMTTVLDYYGITTQDIQNWGGRTDVTVEQAVQGEFDVVAGFLASPALNPESAWWTTISQKYDLYFVELPVDLLEKLARQNVDAQIVEAQNRLLKGINRKIKTLGRSGESVFARDDTPDEAAYDLAKAIDEHHDALKWYIRVYTYDTKTVWQNFGVPLHPGAERYYREAGYLKESGGNVN